MSWMSYRFYLGCLVGICCGYAAELEAVVMRTRRFEEWLGASERVVHIKVHKQTYRLVDDGHRIVTDSECEILSEAMPNSGIDQSLTITSLGGYYQHYGQKVFGLSLFYPEDELVVLIKRIKEEETPSLVRYQVVGLNQGLYFVLPGQTLLSAQDEIASTEVLTRDDVDTLKPQTLEELMQRARGYLETKRQP